MDYQTGHVMTLANSIIGVSILAMPYCFKQCGILLSIIILLVSSVISRLACHFLLKSAIIARRKTFEFLAFHIFGSLGKFAIEIGMIGFLLGTCIAFFVVMGDLGPEIVAELSGANSGTTMRTSILIALGVFCILPLGLLKNVDSLNGVSKATIGFYCCLVLKIIVEALPHIFIGDWTSEVELWRPAGILQCLPIFSMALFCQTQLFEIYQALPNASLEKMNNLIRIAVNICTCVYIFVGTFGYIAFFQKSFTGNILLSFRPSVMSDVMKIGFVLSLAFSFPLVIFPCRASLYSLLYKGPSYTSLHEGTAATTNYIPEGKFKLLTAFIVIVSLIIGILIPNIELVLGLVGSTIGVMICVIFPVTCFICISPRNTNERILAQIMLFVGVIVMVLGTYANLYAFEEVKLSEKLIDKPVIINNNEHADNIIEKILLKPKEEDSEKLVAMDIPTTVKALVNKIDGVNDDSSLPKDKDSNVIKLSDTEVRHEPPQPIEPAEVAPSPKPLVDIENVKKKEEDKLEDNKEKKEKEPAAVPEEKDPDIVKNEEVIENLPKEKQGPVVEPVFPIEEKVDSNKEPKIDKSSAEISEKESEKAKEAEKQKDTGEVKNNQMDVGKPLDSEAINKEENELKEQEKEKAKANPNADQLLIELKKQNEVQEKLVEQQKKLIEVIQQQQQVANNSELDKVNEVKVQAFKEIENIARKAIETISGKDKDKANDLNKNSDSQNEIKLNNKQQIDENKNVVKVDLVPQLNLEKEKEKESKQPEKKIDLLPLPIALAKASEQSKASGIKQNNSVQPKDDDVKSMRRDILSENNNNNNNLDRVKRDIDTINVKENENVINKENVCKDIDKFTSTEKPVIKMLCKLSEPHLVNLDMSGFDIENNVDLKPQKRDLKQTVV